MSRLIVLGLVAVVAATISRPHSAADSVCPEGQELAVVAEVHPLSGRQAVFEDDGTVAYLYRITPGVEGEREIDGNCWVYNRVPLPDPSEIEEYLPDPPPAAIGFTASSHRQCPPAAADIGFQWAVDGQSVALFIEDRVVAYISDQVGEEIRQANARSWQVQHSSMSRDLSEPGPWGVPWNEEEYRRIFRNAAAPHPAALMPDSGGDDSPVSGEEGPPVLELDVTEEEVNAAIAEAQASFDSFIEQLESPEPDLSGFSVKVGLEDGDAVEHVWLGDPAISGDAVSGTILNSPQYISNYQSGQRITVSRAAVSDWLYIEAGRLRGGFTLRLFRDRMSPDERAEFEAGLGFEIE